MAELRRRLSFSALETANDALEALAPPKAWPLTPRPAPDARAAPVPDLKQLSGLSLSGLLSASFIARVRQNWRAAALRAACTAAAFALCIFVLYFLAVEALHVATTQTPLHPHDEERVDLNQRVWRAWLSSYGERLVYGGGPAALHVAAFWGTNCGLGLLDRFRPAWAEHYRIDVTGERPARPASGGAYTRVAANQLCALIGALLAAPLVRAQVGDWDATAVPGFGQVLLYILSFAAMTEATTYYTHRLLHTPWLYKHVHFRHHKSAGRSPNGVASLDMHVAEFLLLKFLPVVTGPLLLPGGHLLTVYLWIGISTMVRPSPSCSTPNAS